MDMINKKIKEEQEESLKKRYFTNYLSITSCCNSQPAEFVYLLRNMEMEEYHWNRLQFHLGDYSWQHKFLVDLSGSEYIFYNLYNFFTKLR